MYSDCPFAAYAVSASLATSAVTLLMVLRCSQCVPSGLRQTVLAVSMPPERAIGCGRQEG